MSKSFKGKTVVITGATAGIGLAAAAMFEERGAHVICVARHESDRFESVCADISDGEQVKRTAERIIAKHGGIDILVNNAGGGISGTIEDSDPEDVKRLFDVNFFGALNFIREVLPSMRERGGTERSEVRDRWRPLSVGVTQTFNLVPQDTHIRWLRSWKEIKERVTAQM